MNKFLFVLSCSLLMDGLRAQPVDFAPVGVKWYINQIVLEPIPADSFVIVEVTGEELKAGQLCRVIENLSGCGLPNPAHVFSRNDSVFFYSTVTNAFELLYDYTAQVGGTWTVKGLSNFNGQDIQVEVTNIFPWTFGSDTLMAMTIKTTPFPDAWGPYILEKIGGRVYLSPTYMEDCGFGPEIYMPYVIRCYEEDGKIYHFNPVVACDEYYDISLTSDLSLDHGIMLVPNPARARVWVGLSEALASEAAYLMLYDLMGRPVWQQTYEGGDVISIDLLAFSPGIYVLQVQGRDGRRWTEKVVVE